MSSDLLLNVTNSTAGEDAQSSFNKAVFSLILIPIIFIFIVMFFGLTGARSTKRRNEIKKLKARVKGLSSDGRAFGVQALPLSSTSLDNIDKETQRCRQIAARFKPDPKRCVVSGWGRLDSKFKTNHFRSTIIQSYELLKRKIRQDMPEHEDTPAHTMLPSDHMLELLRSTPSLDERLCRLYLSTYESARFGNADFNETQYKKLFLRVVKILTLTTNDDMDDLAEDVGHD